MQEPDFWEAMRDDADDVLVRHAYADWLDERGDPAGEYYRLCGDLIGADDWSVDAHLIRARMHRLRQTVLLPRWSQEFEASGLGWIGREARGGLVRLSEPLQRLPASVARLAERVPLCGAELGGGDEIRGGELDWLSELCAGEPGDLLALFRRSPDVATRIRALRIARPQTVRGTELGQFLSGLHRLELRSAVGNRQTRFVGQLPELRELIVSGYRQDAATLLRACPPSLRRLDFSLLVPLHSRSVLEGSLADVDLPNLRTVTLRCEPFYRSQRKGRGARRFPTLDEFATSPLFRSASAITLHGLRLAPDAVPVEPPPPKLARLVLEEPHALVDVRDLLKAWGAGLRSLRVRSGTSFPMWTWNSLLESAVLRDLDLPAGGEFLRLLAGSPLGSHLESLRLTQGLSTVDLLKLGKLSLPALRALDITLDYGDDCRAMIAADCHGLLRNLLRSDFGQQLEALTLRTPLSRGSHYPLPPDLPDVIGPRVRTLTVDCQFALDPKLSQSLIQSRLPEQLDRLTLLVPRWRAAGDHLFRVPGDAFPQQVVQRY